MRMHAIPQLRTQGDSLTLNVRLHASRGTRSTLRAVPTVLAVEGLQLFWRESHAVPGGDSPAPDSARRRLCIPRCALLDHQPTLRQQRGWAVLHCR
ncbi:hypothetical protein NDU88_005347 [Pleurodeles waltl]|uniref:Uncharacterized protein n=1 Tax=Pleurodeles waltl TaxID=8319 RepID=A0AAV7SLJ5_PLEWA|nr:hypothetical protein NDU88_005347 [Pleurodeles waltl]